MTPAMTPAARCAELPPELVTGHVVGVDLGQASDPTAIAVARRFEPTPPADGTGTPRAAAADRARRARFEFVHLERVTLGTPYPAVVARVQAILALPELGTRQALERDTLRREPRVELVTVPQAPALAVDATGVGRPVVDMLRGAGLSPVAISITGGDTVAPDRGGFRVPKRDLVGTLQVLLQTGRLKIAAGLPHARTLVDELLRFRVKIDPLTAHDSYGAWREGEHDDLVLAAAVACWVAMRPDPPTLPPMRSPPLSSSHFVPR